jgi:hypothetical protein
MTRPPNPGASIHIARLEQRAPVIFDGSAQAAFRLGRSIKSGSVYGSARTGSASLRCRSKPLAERIGSEH